MSYVSNARPKGAGWFLPLACVSVVAVAAWCILGAPRLVHLVPNSAAGALGVAIGGAIVPTLVVWAVSYFAFLRRTAAGRGWILLPLLLGVAVAINFVVVSTVRQGRQADASEARVAVEEMRSAMKAVGNHAQGATFDPRTKAQGGAGALEGVFKSVAARSVADGDAYRKELAAAGYPDFLKPSRLGAPGGLKRARAGLKSVQDIVARYRALSGTRLVEARAALQHCGASEAACEAAVDGFDKSRGEGEAFSRRIWEYETKIVGEMDAMVADLAKARGRWTVQGEKMLFASQADLDVRKAHLETVERLVAEQTALKRAQLQKNDQQFDRMQADLQAGAPAN